MNDSSANRGPEFDRPPVVPQQRTDEVTDPVGSDAPDAERTSPPVPEDVAETTEQDPGLAAFVRDALRQSGVNRVVPNQPTAWRKALDSGSDEAA